VRYRRCFRPELEKTLVEWVLFERLKGSKVSSSVKAELQKMK
jgi:hypothetical protein